MKTKTINQAIDFDATPKQLYDALMDSKKHSQFTNSPAKISPKVGGKFSAYDGYIEGENIELVPGRKIVQKWRSRGWPEGHYSKVTFEFEKIGEYAKLTFTQEGVPEDDYKAKFDGWFEHYWNPMKEMFRK